MNSKVRQYPNLIQACLMHTNQGILIEISLKKKDYTFWIVIIVYVYCCMNSTLHTKGQRFIFFSQVTSVTICSTKCVKKISIFYNIMVYPAKKKFCRANLDNCNNKILFSFFRASLLVAWQNKCLSKDEMRINAVLLHISMIVHHTYKFIDGTFTLWNSSMTKGNLF